MGLGAKAPQGSPGALAVWQLGRLFWWDSDRRVRAEAVLRLAAVVSVQLVKGRAGAYLSSERRRQVDLMLRGGGSDRRGILRGMVRYLGALLLLSPVNKLYWRFLRGLRQQWDRHLTSHFVAHFVEAQCLSYGTKPDGGGGSPGGAAPPVVGVLPDQRIASDVGTFVQLSTSLALEALQACIHLYFFTSVLRDISPALSWSVVAAAVVGTTTTRWLGRPLTTLYAAERNADGDFRYGLTLMRENAESIAFYSGQRLEVERMESKLSRRLNTEWIRMARRDVVQLFSTSFRQVAGLLPVFMLAGRMGPATAAAEDADAGRGHGSHGRSPHHGHSHMPHGHGGGGGGRRGTDVGAVNQAREVFDDVLYHLLILAENTNDFSRLATVAAELHTYEMANRQALQRRSSTGLGAGVALLPLPTPPPAACPSVDAEGGARLEAAPWLRIEGLSLFAPGDPPRPLLRELSLDLAVGGLLISGPSGVGKTTLLRAIAGLWHSGTGTIRRELDPRRVLFLPQRPYLQSGSLREQLLYPSGGSDSFGEYLQVSDSDLRGALQRVGLEHVLQRVGGNLSERRRWSEELSIGEQQRLSVARALVHRPAYAILDETTAANDALHERTIYQCVMGTCTSFVSVGHRKSIEAFHAKKLTLYGEHEGGRWELETL